MNSLLYSQSPRPALVIATTYLQSILNATIPDEIGADLRRSGLRVSRTSRLAHGNASSLIVIPIDFVDAYRPGSISSKFDKELIHYRLCTMELLFGRQVTHRSGVDRPASNDLADERARATSAIRRKISDREIPTQRPKPRNPVGSPIERDGVVGQESLESRKRPILKRTATKSLRNFVRMVPGDGVEPPTLRFSVACSTN